MNHMILNFHCHQKKNKENGTKLKIPLRQYELKFEFDRSETKFKFENSNGRSVYKLTHYDMNFDI